MDDLWEDLRWRQSTSFPMNELGGEESLAPRHRRVLNLRWRPSFPAQGQLENLKRSTRISFAWHREPRCKRGNRASVVVHLARSLPFPGFVWPHGRAFLKFEGPANAELKDAKRACVCFWERSERLSRCCAIAGLAGSAKEARRARALPECRE